MFLAVPYKAPNEIVYVNLSNVSVAMPRPGKVNVPGEKKGKTYTSFLLVSYVGNSATLDTLYEWHEFMQDVAPYETAWDPAKV